ncbi:hypothetical protein [Methylobacterium sp. E-045]|uniref:hypothetical protein n=1 Tax=Methylobacterium sp. E-045 TaxID=2836575 RepID=UPI001FBA1D3F|nr:hypothetical protein [Methylobacterium sp. E-045]MCJ2127570.1 hypothetical protein [Methylobacterium sp. E-045]
MDELKAVWRDVFAQIAASSILASDALPLTAYAFGKFNPKLVLERLLDPRPSYFAHKDILFAGLCAWTVAPKHQFLIEEAMVLAGAARLAAVEKEIQGQLPEAPMLADIITRVSKPGIDFYQDFYYPVGGLQCIIKTRSPKLMQRSLQAASREIGFAVEMMRVCHYHAIHLQDRKRYRLASYASGGQALSDLLVTEKSIGGVVNPLLAVILKKNRTVDALNCKKKSDRFKWSAAMIYAAHSIKYDGDTLLSLICSGAANFAEDGHLLAEWVGRAAYVASKVIELMYTNPGNLVQIEYLSSNTTVDINPPDYGTASVNVEKAFKTAHTNPQNAGGSATSKLSGMGGRNR